MQVSYIIPKTILQSIHLWLFISKQAAYNNMKKTDVLKSIFYFDILNILSKGLKDIILNFSKTSNIFQMVHKWIPQLKK